MENARVAFPRIGNARVAHSQTRREGGPPAARHVLLARAPPRGVSRDPSRGPPPRREATRVPPARPARLRLQRLHAPRPHHRPGDLRHLRGRVTPGRIRGIVLQGARGVRRQFRAHHGDRHGGLRAAHGDGQARALSRPRGERRARDRDEHRPEPAVHARRAVRHRG